MLIVKGILYTLLIRALRKNQGREAVPWETEIVFYGLPVILVALHLATAGY